MNNIIEKIDVSLTHLSEFSIELPMKDVNKPKLDKNKKIQFKYTKDILCEILSYNDLNNIENFFLKTYTFFIYNQENQKYYLDFFEYFLKYFDSFYPSKDFIKKILNTDFYEFYTLCKKYNRIPKSLSSLNNFCDIFNKIFHIYNFEYHFDSNNDIQSNLHLFTQEFIKNDYLKKENIPKYFQTTDIIDFLKNIDLLFIFDEDIFFINIDDYMIDNIYLQKKLLNNLYKLYINDHRQRNYLRDYINDYFNKIFSSQININNNKFRFFDMSFEFIYKNNENFKWYQFISDFSKNNQINIFQNLYFYIYLTILYFTKEHSEFDNIYVSFIYSYEEHDSVLHYKIPKIKNIENLYWGNLNQIKKDMTKYLDLYKFLRNQYLESYLHFSKKQYYFFFLKNIAYFLLY